MAMQLTLTLYCHLNEMFDLMIHALIDTIEEEEKKEPIIVSQTPTNYSCC